MVGLFFRQLGALFWKNWIVLGKHPVLNIIRCFVLPVAFGVFLSAAQGFFFKRNNFGIADPVAIRDFKDRFDGSLKLVWADNTDGTGSPSPNDIIARITQGFSNKQLNAVVKVESTDDIPVKCPQNFNLFSECFAGLSFEYLPSGPKDIRPINYTILGNGGFGYINAIKHTSDYELYVLPLQWAVDRAIIELRTGAPATTPLEWPFSNETNEEETLKLRLSYIRGIRSIISLVLFIAYIGIAYHLPGSFSDERANLLTSHLKAMGLKDSARIVSWHLSISLAYLPGWIIMALVWKFHIFAGTSVAIILLVNLLLPLSLASWTFFVAAPFGKSPQLAAITSVLASFILAILALVLKRASNGLAFIFTIFFPPGFYIFAIRAICGFENNQIPTNVINPDPDRNLRVIVPVVAAIINIFLWPYIAVLLERKLYEPPNPLGRTWYGRKKPNPAAGTMIPPGIAISVQNLGKDFNPPLFSKKELVSAVGDLSFNVPKNGIFVLLGSNGAGKSTSLSIIGGLLSKTRGRVLFEGGTVVPPRGTIGIVPQKNVLFPDLTCRQTLRLWYAIKTTTGDHEDIDQLLRDCDLEKKINSNASTLSGGQKRKLQLAIGLVGGSKIVLVDECTSGVDPLSRRALWRTLNSVRYDRTVVFTTHFLDEADLLADHIAILATPGKLVAQGSPVGLKSNLGQGYTVEVRFHHTDDLEKLAQLPPRGLLPAIRTFAPNAYVTKSSPFLASYHLKSRDTAVVWNVLRIFDQHSDTYLVDSYDVRGTSIEDLFLDLMNKEEGKGIVSGQGDGAKTEALLAEVPLELSTGRKRRKMSQTLTIFHKRVLIARRAWLPFLQATGVAIVGSCLSLVFLDRSPLSCVKTYEQIEPIPLFLPALPAYAEILVAPATLAASLGSLAGDLIIEPVSDNQEFVSTIRQDYRNISFGGISLDLNSGQSTVAWETDPPGTSALTLLNLVSNIVYNARLNATSPATTSIIGANYASFPLRVPRALGVFRWFFYFGAAMAVYPAFFSLYVSRERRSSVQAMQLSNGLANPLGLWLGHLMFDSLFTVFIATVVTIVYSVATNYFHGLGFLWFIMILYGITATLWAYCVSLFMPSPLASFALAAGYQVIMFLIYQIGYFIAFTYAPSSKVDGIINKIHWGISIASPVASVARAAMVSVNLFNLLCNGNKPVSTSSLGQLVRFGGPILYLIIYGFTLFCFLVWWDSGAVLPFKGWRPRRLGDHTPETDVVPPDVAAEANAVAYSRDSLRVVNVTKVYGRNTVVDKVSFGVAQGDVLALLGPNGAGKTTAFNMIRGDVSPTKGDIFINGISVIQHPRDARLSLGVCPQFTAIDAQLTVREHLLLYGRLKGIPRGPELDRNVDVLLRATTLDEYTDRLASQLSGGNQRKLSLAIAMIGNPTNLLIDEFSTGIDAKMKREMWSVLRNVAVGKAVVITTHSMEEASALANKAGILATRMLAVGTVESLAARYPFYEVHFACRTREEAIKAQQVMSTIPGARMAEDVATRFEVPVNAGGSGHSMTLLELFHALSSRGEFTEYTVERSTLETTFLKVIRENQVAEEDAEAPEKSGFLTWLSRQFGFFTARRGTT